MFSTREKRLITSKLQNLKITSHPEPPEVENEMLDKWLEDGGNQEGFDKIRRIVAGAFKEGCYY